MSLPLNAEHNKPAKDRIQAAGVVEKSDGGMAGDLYEERVGHFHRHKVRHEGVASVITSFDSITC